MANLRYIATVEMEGIKEKYRDKIEKEFVKRYHEIVNEVNPKLEGWNREYDADYGDLKNPDGTVNEDHYNSWIGDKEQSQIDTKDRGKLLEFSIDPIECTITGHIKGYKDQTKIYWNIREA